MAEKGFGVKEVNLIGASGTPTITSPNNLNLNANNVAISTNVSIGGTLSVTGNVSVGGTLTYEDVTNIDSVGLITAREGIKIPDDKYAYFGSDNDLEITHSGSNGNINNKTGDLVIRTLGSGDDIFIDAVDDVNIRVQSTDNAITCIGDGAVTLHYNGNSKLATTNTGVDVTGALTVNGSALSITPTTSDIQVVYEITNSSSTSYYRFAGNGVDSSANNPDLYLARGKKYRFINNSGGIHPFRIQSDNGTTLYSTGVTNNNASSGNIDFAIRWDAPSRLYYKCGSHPSMLGNIYLTGGSGSVNKPKNPAFYAYNLANNAVYTAGTVVPWPSTTVDTRSAFATSGSDIGRYTIPTTGLYFFGWRLNRLGDSRFDLAIYVNGSIKYYDELRSDHGTGVWQAESGHYIFDCTAGQKIDLRIASVANAGSGQFDGGTLYDAFFGYMIG